MIERNPNCISCAVHESLCSGIDLQTLDILEARTTIREAREVVTDSSLEASVATAEAIAEAYLEATDDASPDCDELSGLVQRIDDRITVIDGCADETDQLEAFVNAKAVWVALATIAVQTCDGPLPETMGCGMLMGDPAGDTTQI